VFQVGVDGAGAAAQLAKLGLIADADGRVIALLRDDGPRTKSVVVIRPATL